MAMNLRGLCRLNFSLANNVLFKPNFINVGFIRCLYTEYDLGITTYENARFLFRNQFMSIEDTFRTKMKELCEQENGVVYTEDLKAMLHLARESDDDMELLNNMLTKYVQTEHERKFSAYAFSPVVMRLYYYLNKPEQALAMFDNPLFADNFDYRSSFRILMCLLFKHGMYKEIRDVYDKVFDAKGISFIGSAHVIMYAACLKENTQEAFEYALERWNRQYSVLKPGLRSSYIMSLLAIKQNTPDAALEILSIVDRQTSVPVRSLKVLAYMKLQRYMQIIPMLKHALELRDTAIYKEHFFADVIYELEEKLDTEEAIERKDLLSLIGDVKKYDLIDTRHTLEEYLLRPMGLKKERLDKVGKNFDRTQSTQSNQSTQSTRSTYRQNRTGLKNFL
ncbi:pentatricopeptide repeat-containing protein 2, mitochondrial [Xylocopa sonorina]|uniref:pentatricopeptide repeat-containing protein 2, mitochondrial n=1 Tax=Xylocopa sonorina TaxID=1818115 RepID=UPI00403AB729